LLELIRDLGAELVNLWLDDGVADVNAGSFVELEECSLSVSDLYICILDNVKAIVPDHHLFATEDLFVALHGSLVKLDDLPKLVPLLVSSPEDDRPLQEVCYMEVAQCWRRRGRWQWPLMRKAWKTGARREALEATELAVVELAVAWMPDSVMRRISDEAKDAVWVGVDRPERLRGEWGLPMLLIKAMRLGAWSSLCLECGWASHVCACD